MNDHSTRGGAKKGAGSIPAQFTLQMVTTECEFCGYDFDHEGLGKYGCANCHGDGLKPTRGGARPGAGRKPGSGTGRTVTTSSINLLPELWDKLDAIRGEHTRSAWISAKIKNARKV